MNFLLKKKEREEKKNQRRRHPYRCSVRSFQNFTISASSSHIKPLNSSFAAICGILWTKRTTSVFLIHLLGFADLQWHQIPYVPSVFYSFLSVSTNSLCTCTRIDNAVIQPRMEYLGRMEVREAALNELDAWLAHGWRRKMWKEWW